MLKSITRITTILIVLYSSMLSAQDTLTICMVDVVVESDDSQITIPFKVIHFDTVSYFQYSIEWDSTVFDFSSVGNFNLDGLTEGAFNLSESAKESGKVGFSWIDPAAQATTVPDSTRIFDLVLDIITRPEEGSKINFTNDPTAVEAGNVNNVEIPMKTIGANISFAQETTSSTENFITTNHSVFQNEPNPFEDRTSIPFELSKGANVLFEVFDSSGRKHVSEKSYYPQGLNYKELNKRQLDGPGMYEYSLTIDKITITNKLVLMNR